MAKQRFDFKLEEVVTYTATIHAETREEAEAILNQRLQDGEVDCSHDVEFAETDNSGMEVVRK